jgi:hypothetical protein
MVESLKDKNKLNMWVPESATSSPASFILPFCSLFLYLFGSYKIWFFLLEKYESFLSEHLSRFLFILIPYSIVLVFLNILFTVLYYFDKQFTWRYKINSHPWPWEENPEKWKIMLPKGLKLYVMSLTYFASSPLHLNLTKSFSTWQSWAPSSYT